MTIHHVTLDQLPALFRQLETARMQRVGASMMESALAGVPVLVKAAPNDLGEVRRSIHAEQIGSRAARTLIDAPHAGIVELGSRPHWAPLAPLVAWVRRHRASFAGSIKRRVQLRRLITKNLSLSTKHIKAAAAARWGRRKPGFGLDRHELFDAHMDRARSLRASTKFLRRQYRMRH